ncbi:MAG: zinc-binding dehydrogenase [Clostridiales bacterium]|jgi:threonine dehydrogenase-like Zn-dependent dehydrogenase|nr:zinc-binding dehydrogenase [Clostridiales bacterium]
MKTKAIRLYGKGDLRLEEFELPPIKEDEILARIVTDSICMSTYKAVKQGKEHKRVPPDADVNPVITGHEFCGELVEVGKKWGRKFRAGQKFTVQPAMNYKGSLYAPGYSYRYIGGNATYVIIPNEVMECECLLAYESDSFFTGSLAEPMSCIVGAFHASYHTESGSYVHKMGIVEGGKTAILAGVGPMGLGAIDYALNCDRKPSLLVVTDIDEERLNRAGNLFSPEYAAERGVNLVYFNSSGGDATQKLLELSGGTGYDDVFVFAPVKALVEQADRILGRDGCLNFFAGPTDKDFSASFNFYNVHYNSTHIVGTSGGNTDDMRESIELMSKGRLNPAVMVTHIGGIDSVIDTVMNLPDIKGGKKLIYNTIEMPLVAIADFEKLGRTNEVYRELAAICARNKGLWNVEAEKYLLRNAHRL